MGLFIDDAYSSMIFLTLLNLGNQGGHNTINYVAVNEGRYAVVSTSSRRYILSSMNKRRKYQGRDNDRDFSLEIIDKA